MTDALLVNSNNLGSAKRILQMWDDALATAVKRGANVVIPYADFELRTDKKRSSRDFTAGYLIKGTSYADLNDEIDAFYALLPALTADDTSCTLTRRRTHGSGTVDKTVSAEYLGGITPNLLTESDRHARLTVRFRLLGEWA